MFLFSGQINKIPRMLRALSSKMGNMSSGLMDMEQRNNALLKMLHEQNAVLADNVRMRTINMFRWLPINCDRGARRFIRVSY